MDQDTLKYYAQNADAVAARYESIVNKLSYSFGDAFIPSSRILDVGCGSGRDLATLASLGHDCFGIDGTPEFVELAQKLHPELGGRITHGTLPNSEIPFGGGFDGVLCSAVLMHLPADQLELSAAFIRNCLKEPGRLLYSVPSKRLDVGNKDRYQHGRLFLPDQSDRLEKIFEQHGLRVIKRWGDSDSFCRGEVEWVSVLMQVESA